MTIVGLNRALMGLFLLAVSAAVVMIFWWEPVPAESANQQLPLRISYNKIAPAEWHDLQISTENPFSRDGKPWKFEYAAATQKTTKKGSMKAAPEQLKDISLEGVNGFVKLPGLSALMTKDGVVREGSLFQGATVKSLQLGEVVFIRGEHDEATKKLTTGRTPLDKIHIQGFPRYPH